MKELAFHNGKELLKLAKEEKLKISQLMIQYEIENSEKPEDEIRRKMFKRYQVIKRAIEFGVEGKKKSLSGMSGENAAKIYKSLTGKTKMVHSPLAIKAMAYAVATGETNACMGQIVAFPTAGAAGVMPGVLIAMEEDWNLTADDIVNAMFNSSAVGMVITRNASVSGAEGGCQAEVGAATAMAASAITELRGGSPEDCLNAAALALKNMLGLVCDPIAGMVEVPCIKRNAFATAHAFTASDLTMCGVKSFVPFDEVVEALKNISKIMPSSLRETALGGLAMTKTGKRVKENLGFK